MKGTLLTKGNKLEHFLSSPQMAPNPKAGINLLLKDKWITLIQWWNQVIILFLLRIIYAMIKSSRSYFNTAGLYQHSRLFSLLFSRLPRFYGWLRLTILYPTYSIIYLCSFYKIYRNFHGQSTTNGNERIFPQD